MIPSQLPMILFPPDELGASFLGGPADVVSGPFEILELGAFTAGALASGRFVAGSVVGASFVGGAIDVSQAPPQPAPAPPDVPPSFLSWSTLTIDQWNEMDLFDWNALTL